MAKRYARNMPHPYYSESRLRLVGELLLDVLAQPCSEAETLASCGHAIPKGKGWRSWPWTFPRLALKLNELLGPGCRRGQFSAAVWRLADAGVVNVQASPVRRHRGRIRFLRLHPPGEPAVALPAAPERSCAPYEYYADERLSLLKSVLLEVLALPCSRLELLANTTWPAPAGLNWIPWPLVTKRFSTRTAHIICSTCTTIVSRAAWPLADAGQIQVATTPMRGRPRGRIRFARLAQAEATCF